MRDRYASLRDGLVGAWIPSVSGSGLLLPDLSGNGNNGALTNMGPEDWVSGQYGRALDFDGALDYVTTSVTPTGDTGTISCWAYFRTLNSGTHALVFSGGGTYILINQFSNSIFWYWYTGGPQIQSTGVLTTNKWLHFAMLRNNGVVYAYFNGVQIGSASGGTTWTATTAYFGGWPGQGDRTINGQLDDIRIYNRALSEPEIKLLASRPGIGLKPQRRTMYYAPPTGARRRRILTSMP